jgi:hypothetical protein
VNEPTGNAKPKRRRGRSVLAVLAGLVVIFVLSIGTDQILHSTGVYPPWGQTMSDGLFGVATLYRIAYGILGCWLTARLAPDRPMKHALMLGFIGLAFSLAGLVAAQKQGPELGPLWYSLAIVAISLPCAWLGGRIRLAQLRERTAS